MTKFSAPALSIVLCVSCADPPARFLDDGLVPFRGEPTDLEIRLTSGDLYEFATAHWRFYDDYLERQPSACADEFDGGVDDWPYLWRHGIESERRIALEINSRLYGGRAGLDVSALGIVALQGEGRLWTFAADGGQPLHADKVGLGPGVLMGAFATDPLFWNDYTMAPRLLDLSLPRSRIDGWPAVYNWRDAHGTDGAFDFWYQASAAVRSDGTLIWTSGAGTTRALKTNGEIEWESRGVEGPLLVTSDDVVVRSMRGDMVALSEDGGVRWWEPTLDGGTPRPRAIVDEGRYPSRHVPMFYEREAFVLRDARDGRIAARLDAGSWAPVVVGMDRDGWVFLNAQESSTTLSLSALTPTLQQVWKVPANELEFAPFVTANRVVTVDRDCRVTLIDRATGATLKMHRMVGRAYRYLPRLYGGVLYVTAEVRPTVNVKPSEMHGTLRLDGGVIDVSEYGCYLPAAVDTSFCPPIEVDGSRAVYAVYAFQVE